MKVAQGALTGKYDAASDLTIEGALGLLAGPKQKKSHSQIAEYDSAYRGICSFMMGVESAKACCDYIGAVGVGDDIIITMYWDDGRYYTDTHKGVLATINQKFDYPYGRD